MLRHANVSTTATYYIKSAADDVRKAMTKLENQIVDGGRISIGHRRDARRQFARGAFHGSVNAKWLGL